MTEQDLAFFIKNMTAALSVNYTEEGTLDNMKCKMVARMAYKDGYSSKEFREVTKEFIKRNKFPTWTPADFFEIPRRRLYTWQQANELTEGQFDIVQPVYIEGIKNPLWELKENIELTNKNKQG